MFYLIGLGLADEKDITVKGFEIVKKCSRVYLETYTSILMVDKEKLESFYQRPILLADRTMVESDSESILELAGKEDIALLIVGDPFGATTHCDIYLRAKEKNIPVQAIHNASIMNAIGCTGLQLYQFGQTVSIVFFTKEWCPDSFYDKIKANHLIGLHTLCLLDIKVKEQTIDNLMKGNTIYEPPMYMTIQQAIEQLMDVESRRQEGLFTSSTLAVGVARIGSVDQKIVTGTFKELLTVDFGPPLHSLILPGQMHLLEQEMVRHSALHLHTYDKYILNHQ